ncbi:MAG: hypothetical protein R2860_05300 [Desulfobacterales bacterium]
MARSVAQLLKTAGVSFGIIPEGLRSDGNDAGLWAKPPCWKIWKKEY